jgi:hypothetical protein
VNWVVDAEKGEGVLEGCRRFDCCISPDTGIWGADLTLDAMKYPMVKGQ